MDAKTVVEILLARQIGLSPYRADLLDWLDRRHDEMNAQLTDICN